MCFCRPNKYQTQNSQLERSFFQSLIQLTPLNDPKNPCKVSIGKTHIYQHTLFRLFRTSSFIFYCVVFWWLEQRRIKAEKNRQIEKQRGWGLNEKQPATKSGECFKGHLKMCRLQIVPRWRQMISGAQISVSNVSYIPLVAVWQFINLHDAKDCVSPLTLQTGLCSARKRRSIHHVLHTVWHQLETRSPPFEKPFAWRMWLLLVGTNEPSQFMWREMSSLALLCRN